MTMLEFIALLMLGGAMKTFMVSAFMILALWGGTAVTAEISGPIQKEIASRFNYAGRFRLTHYTYGKITSSGAKACSSYVATDQAVLPEGTIVYIAGVGFRTCLDKGGLVRGHRIDLRGHYVDPPDSVDVWVVCDPPGKKDVK